MSQEQPHFSVQSFLPSLQSLENSLQAMVNAAGGDQAVLDEALKLLQSAMGNTTIPLSLIEEIVALIAKAAKSKSPAAS